MNTRTATIEQYLTSTCLFIIDEFNELYKGMSKPELKEISNSKYNETDITVRIGYPFRSMVHFTTASDRKKNEYKSNHDLYVESKDFVIEVKFAKNWDSAFATPTNKGMWKDYLNDFKWITDEVKNNKGKRAFVIGWFNSAEYFGQIMQLGQGGGKKPKANLEKVGYFPFLLKKNAQPITSEVVYNYNAAYKPLKVDLVGTDVELDCLFLGSNEDAFHFAIYY